MRKPKLIKRMLTGLMVVAVMLGSVNYVNAAEDEGCLQTIEIDGQNVFARWSDEEIVSDAPEVESKLLGIAAGQQMDMAWQVLRIVNQQRAAAGLNPLTMDQGLLNTAQLRAQEIVTLFSHKRPDGSDCFTAFPSGHMYVGENIAAGYGNASFVMEGWMGSPGHRANIMDSDYSAIGIACYYAPGTTYGYYWVQCFGSSVQNEVKPIEEVKNTDGTTAMYRMYNPNSGEHFYTAVYAEAKNLFMVGWNYEGIAWYAPTSGSPVYRLYNANAGDHHYTTSLAEKDHLVSVGWSYEGIAWRSGGSVPLYRAYNPNAKTGSHHYTINKGEINSIVAAGWKDEGIGWYGVK